MEEPATWVELTGFEVPNDRDKVACVGVGVNEFVGVEVLVKVKVIVGLLVFVEVAVAVAFTTLITAPVKGTPLKLACPAALDPVKSAGLLRLAK